MHLVNIEGDSGNHRQGREAAVEKARGKKKRVSKFKLFIQAPACVAVVTMLKQGQTHLHN